MSMELLLGNNCDTSATGDRILYLSGDVEGNNISEVCKQILQINEFDRQCLEKYRSYEIKPIQLHIQSFGGVIVDMWSLVDIIEASVTPIITYCSGYCMSAAAVIFMSGHIRYMYKHSQIMLHQLSAGSFGKLNDIKTDATRFDIMNERVIKYIKKNTTLPKSVIKSINSGEDVYLTAKECKKYGICDKVIKKGTWRKDLLDQYNALEETDLDEFEC